MRGIGLFCILIGLVLAFGHRPYHDTFTNFEIGEYTIADHGSYSTPTIVLSPDDAPVEMLIDTQGYVRSNTNDARTTMQINIASDSTTLLDTMLDLSADNTSINFPLNVEETGLYTFNFTPQERQDYEIENITITLNGLVTPYSNTVPNIGYVLLSLGALMYLVGGRKKSKRTINAPSGKSSKTAQIGRRVEPEAPKLEKKTHKWGRGED